MESKFFFTHSEQERLAVFLPGKTGTMHATFMLNHFNFKTNTYGKDNRELILEEDYVIHHHCEVIPKGYEHYNVIYTVRNPYTRLVSMYHHDERITRDKETTPKTFKQYFSNKVNNGRFHMNIGFNFIKIPRYLLRMEHLYEDYIKIPFIRDSKLNKSGVLYDLCNKKIHTKNQETKPLREYYTQDMADHVYETLKPYFDLTGYDKDSWKRGLGE
jgi:hypothetical protein